MATAAQYTKAVLHDFSHETTLHGVKYLTTNSWFRRILWCGLLAGGIYFCVTQIINKIKEYNDNPITTNIDIEYPKALVFPQVAFCNINQYRISETTKDIYAMITDTQKNKKTMDFTKYSTQIAQATASHSDSKKYLSNAAHQISDMLLLCKLPEGGCSVANFTQILTDFGVCYTINYDVWKPLTVTSAGVDAGFSMILNIENYERMQAGLISTGIKLVIFNQTTMPLVAYSSIDLPPGYMSQVAVEYVERNEVSVEDGGTCKSNAPTVHFKPQYYQMQSCRLDKVFSEIESRCKCFAYHTPAWFVNANKTYSYCSIKDHFSCVDNNKVMTGEAAKSCFENCTTIEYPVTLSFSKLSGDTIHDVTMPYADKMKQHFARATEARARYELPLVEHMSEKITNLRNASFSLDAARFAPLVNFTIVYERTQKAVPCFQSITTNSAYKSLLSDPGPGSSQKQSSVFGMTSDQRMAIFSDTPFTSTNFNGMLTNITNAEKLGFAADVFLDSVTAATVKTYLNQNTTGFTTDLNEVLSIVDNFMHYYTASYWMHESGGQTSFTRDDDTYLRLFKFLNRYESMNLTKLDLANAMKNELKELGQYMEKLMSYTVDAYANALMELQAPKDAIPNQEYLASVVNASDFIPFMQYVSFMLFFPNYPYKSPPDCTRNQVTYLICKKALLASGYYFANESLDAVKYNSGWSSANPGVPSSSNSVATVYAACSDTLKSGGGGPGQGGGGGASTMDTVPADGSCKLTNQFDATQLILELEQCTSIGLQKGVIALKDEVTTLMDNFKNAYSQLDRDLDTYAATFQWGTDFYNENILSVNIYFKDMSKKYLTQSQGYDIFSLFCDVGGTLGLFLGASLLSFFEILDIMIFHALACRKEKQLLKQKSSIVSMISESSVDCQLPVQPTVSATNISPPMA